MSKLGTERPAKASLTAAEIAALPYRQGVGVVLFNSAGKVFLGQRLDTPGAWQMPQGGIDPGEDPEATAFRELEEEIGTTKAEVLAVAADWLSYDLPPEIVPTIWRGRFRGQRQKWFALKFLGKDSDIDLKTAHPEFDAWRWALFEEIAATIVPFKRPLYEALLEEFAPVAARLKQKTS